MGNRTDNEEIFRNGNVYSTQMESLFPSKILWQDEISTKHGKVINDIKIMLRNAGEDSLESLIMIDALQHLGIDYHFQDEVQEISRKRYEKYKNICSTDCDLFEISTHFRILRQEGYHVATDIFNKFIDKKGKLKPQLSKDMRGLMSFYEASQLRTDGEEDLDEAADSSAQFLNELIPILDHCQAKEVNNTLQYPYHKNIVKFTFRNLSSEGKQNWVEALQELARMDSYMIHESIHKKEVFQVFRWWKDVGLAKDLKFIRNQPLKWYMWSMATLTHPSLSEQRIDLTKCISFVYVIDDIFDVYGTLEDLTLFTKAVNRWELDDLKQLPDYMKICFKALYHVTNGIAEEIYRKYGWNPIDSFRKEWGSLCNAFLVEARWFASGKIPNTKEYLKNGIHSSGVQLVLTHMFFLLGGEIDKESAFILDNNPGLINCTATILRLWDDLGSAKDENQDGNDGSYVECYMKENKGCTIEIARKHVTEMIAQSWKRLNKECLSKSSFSKTFKKGCLNSARMVSMMYTYDENQSLPLLKEYMKTLMFMRDDISNI